MDVMMRRRELMMAGGGLPGTYRRVEYLESTGTQYIDSGIAPSALAKVVCDGQFTASGQTQSFGTYGSGGDTPQRRFYCPRWNVGDNFYRIIIGTQVPSTNATPDTNRHVFVADRKNQYYAIDSSVFQVTGNSDACLTNFMLFANLGTYAVENYCKFRAYEFWIYDNDVLILHLLPCVRKSDSVAGMYDTVSKTFYTNAGTGEFIVPPPDTSPRIAEYGYTLNRSGTGKEANANWCYTNWYAVNAVSGKNTIVDNTTKTDRTYQFDTPPDGNTYDYWYGPERSISIYSKIRASIPIADIDNAYMYSATTGQIIYAGKNSIYYGYTNINDMPSA